MKVFLLFLVVVGIYNSLKGQVNIPFHDQICGEQKEVQYFIDTINVQEVVHPVYGNSHIYYNINGLIERYIEIDTLLVVYKDSLPKRIYKKENNDRVAVKSFYYKNGNKISVEIDSSENYNNWVKFYYYDTCGVLKAFSEDNLINGVDILSITTIKKKFKHKVVYEIFRGEDGLIQKRVINNVEDGVLESRTTINIQDPYFHRRIKETFRINRFDEKGNWVDMDHFVNSKKAYIYKRTILYY